MQIMSVTQMLDIIIPYKTDGCGLCNRQIALQRLAFAEWIDGHKNLSDDEIIKRLKEML